MHKYSQNKLPKKRSSFFTPVNAIHSQTTRLASSGLNLSLPFYRTEKLQRSYKFQGVIIGNSVPQEMKILSFNQFKIKLKKRLISKYQDNSLYYLNVIAFKSLKFKRNTMKRNIAQKLIQEIYVNVQQPEMTTREQLDPMTERSLRNFLLQFMKPYLFVYVRVYFPYPFITVV